MGQFETIRYSTRDDVAGISLARPDKRNAINERMFNELGDAIELAAQDPSVRALVVSGEGPSFCAGIDLGALPELAEITGARFRSFVSMAQRPFRTLVQMEKPAIAAVQGHAVGAGFQLALACDLRVAAPSANFAMLEVRYGLIPDLGGSHRLTRIVGTARAKELVWTGRQVGAEEALAMGLVNHLSKDGDLEAETDRLLKAILAHSPIPQGLTKGLIDRAHETSFDLELDREAEAQGTVLRKSHSGLPTRR
jgi:enoyl-CoA hydratase/carnithine racemase